MQHDLLAQPKQSHQKSLGKTCVKVDLHICSKSKQTFSLAAQSVGFTAKGDHYTKVKKVYFEV